MAKPMPTVGGHISKRQREVTKMQAKPWQVVVIIIGLVAIVVAVWQAWKTFKPPAPPPGPGPMTDLMGPTYGPGPKYGPGPGPMPPGPR